MQFDTNRLCAISYPGLDKQSNNFPRLKRESALFHALSGTGTQDNNFLFLFLDFDIVV